MVRKRRTKTLAVLTSLVMAAGVILAVPSTPAEAASAGRMPMYRLYNPNSGEHFYTSGGSELGTLESAGWKYEGIGWYAPKSSNSPVYRLYNPNAGEHHYTLDTGERDNLLAAGWKDEGIGWYSDDSKTMSLYREYNPNAVTGTHNYTTDKAEHDNLVSLGWRDEGIGWYGVTPPDSDYEQGSSWKKAYKDYMRQIDQYLGYSLVDLNDDGIPELIIQFGADGGDSKEFTYYNGEVVQFDNGRHGGLMGKIKDKPYYTVEVSTSIDYLKQFCRLANGKCVIVLKEERQDWMAYNFGEVNSYTSVYYLNGTEVSKAAYNEAMINLFGSLNPTIEITFGGYGDADTYMKGNFTPIDEY